MSISVCVGCQRLVERSDMRCPRCGASTLRHMTPATMMATVIYGLSIAIAIAIVAGVLGVVYVSSR